MSHETEGERHVIWSQRGQLRDANVSTAVLNDLYMDTSFAGALQQCDAETCEILEKQFDIKPTIGLDESNTVRPSLSPLLPLALSPEPQKADSRPRLASRAPAVQVHVRRRRQRLVGPVPPPHVDALGRAQVDRLSRVVPGPRPGVGAVRLLSRSLSCARPERARALELTPASPPPSSSPRPGPRPRPHPHTPHSYIPVKVDYSDVYDIMAFFVGMPDGSGGHDSLGEKIGQAGRDWARDFWRYEDMACVPPPLSLSAALVLLTLRDEDEPSPEADPAPRTLAGPTCTASASSTRASCTTTRATSTMSRCPTSTLTSVLARCEEPLLVPPSLSLSLSRLARLVLASFI